MGYQKEKKKTCIELLEKETTTCEMKNTLHGYNGKVDITEEKISEFESIAIDYSNETPREKKIFLKNEQNISKLWDNFSWTMCL